MCSDFDFGVCDVNLKHVSTYRKHYQSPRWGGVRLGFPAEPCSCWWCIAWHRAVAATARSRTCCHQRCQWHCRWECLTKASFLPSLEEEVCFRLAVLKSLMLQWLTIFKNICCFIWLPSFLDGFSVRTVNGMLYNPLSGSWGWMESTSLNYALHAVKSGAWARSHATDAPPETDIEQRSATAGTAGTVPDGTVWHVWWWTVTSTENELLLRWTQ